MQKITLIINEPLYKELKEYLLTVTGIKEAELDLSNDQIDILYDENQTSIKLIKMEIELFLNLNKMPYILSFNKHDDSTLVNNTIVIDNLCCEYCLMGMIEELLETKGIISAESDYDYHTKENIKININYNPELIIEDEIEKLEKDFNF